MTKIELFYLTYGRKVILLIDNKENITEISINKRIQYIIEELLKEREKAKE